MVDIKNVFKAYNQKKVIEDVSVHIEKGKITSFIGPNGAGKSTLISMVSRLITKDGGEITIDGKDVLKTKNNEMAKKISILKQSNSINLKLTVRELVSFGRFPYSQGRLKEEDWQKVDEAIDYMELREMQDKFLDELSGGQRQRAHIAMVIAQDTEYILLDEPLNNLDMRHSVQIMKTLRRLVDELNKTIVIVIHDINFASCYSDNIVALKDGKVVKHGKTCDVIDECVLKDIYDMDIDIKNIDDKRICVYF
ncbi:ABC transporter ATP-binding protein [Virgibacillus halodenitrificans]|jgi:iron complex transport system ATP-binding protein|uniref:ABC transporter ATP-binding protein n=1 Tax=Virgibacillus halodenitrificans TaxID=1482 RepID=A0AAC9IZY9_VIRHA|nr:ABC transporter ATP-binding protein [Virgibacillus halodenitrificans]APC47024.1 iron ABC transporter ATP-binding protein [Virgibacillus halodenitrificans]MBD1223070.1 ABC transporter ATP-binding protein [Virgibacillus halodenitrificans]MCJ0930328.1 ABC transporter ATP-binding protein [Virgibacillus halodenitrificans]MYL46844.1 ATP-binding cassette domain-containing protein [Virgibacillus halodenitrificans]MYL57980.1 ATP-binding cassette domain-containing protein [Virgibacillus halodenitrifi